MVRKHGATEIKILSVPFLFFVVTDWPWDLDFVLVTLFENFHTRVAPVCVSLVREREAEEDKLPRSYRVCLPGVVPFVLVGSCTPFWVS